MYLSATALTGDEVADRDDLIEAKLQRRIVRVPPDRVALLREAYRALRTPGPPAGKSVEPASVDLPRSGATPEPT